MESDKLGCTVQLRIHFDTLRTHFGTLGPHLGAPGAQVCGSGNRCRFPGSPFYGFQAAPWQLFWVFAGVLLNMRKLWKNLGFVVVFQRFQKLGGHQNR